MLLFYLMTLHKVIAMWKRTRNLKSSIKTFCLFIQYSLQLSYALGIKRAFAYIAKLKDKTLNFSLIWK